MWLSIINRPDITNALRTCRRQKVSLQVVTYVNATKEIDLRFKFSVYADDDYAAASNDRRSVTVKAVLVCNTAIDWMSSTQNRATTVTSEAECIDLHDASQEAFFK